MSFPSESLPFVSRRLKEMLQYTCRLQKFTYTYVHVVSVAKKLAFGAECLAEITPHVV